MKRLLLPAILVVAAASSAFAYDRNEINFWGFELEPQNQIYAGGIDAEGAKEYGYKVIRRFDAVLRRVPLAEYTPKFSGTSCVIDFRVTPEAKVKILNTDGDKIACDWVTERLKIAHLPPIDTILSNRIKSYQMFFQFTDYEQYLDNSK